MARSNGPFGPAGARPPTRRHPGDDPYAAPHPGQPNGHGGGHNGQWPGAPYPDQGQGGHQGQGYHFPPEPEANYGYNQAPPPAGSYDRHPNGGQQPFPPQQQWGGQQADPRGYDLGSYMPSPGQPYPPTAPNPYQDGSDHGAYAAQRHGYPEQDGEYDQEEFAEEEEPGRGRRWIFIAAIALVGAVGVGGALAYTYKSLFAASPGRVPVVKAEANTKAKAADKMLTRLSDEPTQPKAGEDDQPGEEGGPRRVKTIPITPGGPPAAAQAPPSLPGIMLDNMAPRPQQQAQPKPGQLPPRVTIGVPPPNMVPPQQVQPRVEQAAPTPPPPAVKKVAVAPPPQPPAAPAVTKPAVKPAAAPPPGAAATTSGYVAVLSSQKSHMDALKVFADLQQKYPDALTGKVPDVQQKDLSERGLGTMYRLVVGPPGSRNAASGVCNQLKTAGHEGCWVTEY